MWHLGQEDGIGASNSRAGVLTAQNTYGLLAVLINSAHAGYRSSYVFSGF